MLKGTLFEGVRKGCLVMVVSITEVRSSSDQSWVGKEGEVKLTKL